MDVVVKYHSRRHRPARRVQARQPLTLTAVIACLVATLGISQLTRVAHLALERHVRCEHGQWIHSSHHDRGDAAEQQHHGHAGAAPAVRDEEASIAEHTHCDAVAVAQAPMPDVPDTLIQRCEAWEIHRGMAERAAPASSIPLWLLAPKQSPPKV